MEIIIGAIVFLAGYLTCFFTVKKPQKEEVSKGYHRVTPSFRSPLRTYQSRYKEFQNNVGLYEAQVPKRSDA